MGPPLIAALGPTNTGKTHRALLRMQEFRTGMIGLPLRLLAREVYDKLVKSVGPADVALVTGEEKRVGARARYWVCTVEAMPLDREVEFLAIDEIQLASHPERGHVFTDRLLRARGTLETWFLGSPSIAPLLKRLLPLAEHRAFPRLSTLSFAGSSTLGTLPPRSAIVAFSIQRVYEIAERLRARKGGAAIVSGALSPRARNAQVALYQSGEVDYLVSTDAIGMGLNLEISHIAFAELRKFDGRRSRALSSAEMSQIAGRAGRAQSDGSFGSLAPGPDLSPSLARFIERHRVEPLQTLIWRNPDLDFSSPSRLVESLHRSPPFPFLQQVSGPEDSETLELLLRRKDIADALQHEADLRLLFDLCQIPDYRQLLLERHAQLIAQLFFEIRAHGKIRSQWVAPRIEQLRQHPGDIDSLTARISFIRTWTFVANHSDWMQDARTYRDLTREIEDQLSDALHEALVARFVRKRRAAHFDSPKGTFKQQLLALHRGLKEAEQSERGPSVWVRLCEAPHESFDVDPSGIVTFEGATVGKLERGRHLLEPQIRLVLPPPHEPAPSGGTLKRSERRLRAYAKDFVADALTPLDQRLLDHLGGAGRGLVYQLRQNLTTVERSQVQDQVEELDAEERSHLERSGVHLGTRSVFASGQLKRRALLRRWSLLQASHGPLPYDLASVLGQASFPIPPQANPVELACLGYRRVGRLGIRVDLLERLVETVPRLEEGSDSLGVICGMLGCRKKEARDVQVRLGAHSKKSRSRASRGHRGRALKKS